MNAEEARRERLYFHESDNAREEDFLDDAKSDLIRSVEKFYNWVMIDAGIDFKDPATPEAGRLDFGYVWAIQELLRLSMKGEPLSKPEAMIVAAIRPRFEKAADTLAEMYREDAE